MYIHYDENEKNPEGVVYENKCQNPKQFGEVMKQVGTVTDIKIEDKRVGIDNTPYSKFNVVDNNDNSRSRMFEFANDNRTVKPRINF